MKLRYIAALGIVIALTTATIMIAYSAPITVTAGQTQGIKETISVELCIVFIGFCTTQSVSARGIRLNGDPVSSVTVYYYCAGVEDLEASVQLLDDNGNQIASGSVVSIFPSPSSVTVPISPNPSPSSVAEVQASVTCKIVDIEPG
ncbi:MAG TPA: hypothetical protein EYH45_03110 [Candidatus Caldiarchaeum subterraneum]|uniref:Uncharacterized protein n=1 Tax=Caldiarchaeum subterraneum TaxID=311458 RepID=A0A832ZVP4_CALS0|nr:hypothetical protein [Candidatus Caldarchaeum subterraneum]